MRFLALPEHFTHPLALTNTYNTLQFPDADKGNHSAENNPRTSLANS